MELSVIYENITSIAKKKGMTVREVEERAEIPRGMICKWKKCNPRVENLMKVADVLKVSVSTLVKE